MQKKILVCIVALLSFLASDASHILGGEIGYTFVSATTGTSPIRYTYKVTLKLYRDCSPGSASLGNNRTIRIFDAKSNALVTSFDLRRSDIIQLPPTTTASCSVTPVTGICYELDAYVGEITLNESISGYLISFSDCCRSGAIDNIIAPTGHGLTVTATIPPHTPGFEINSSPASSDSVRVICKNYPVSFKFNFTDPDGDSLSYNYCGAYDGLSNTSITNPPYSLVPYIPGYSGSNPLGGSPPQLSIDPGTGLITGMVTSEGNYVVSMCVSEWRNGTLLNTIRKELQLRADSCNITSLLQPVFQNCKDFTVTFSHSNDPSLQYHWDFGDPLTLTDTSSQVTPTYTYNKADSFNVKMVVRSGADCIDSAVSKVRVFPGFESYMTVPGSPRCSYSPLLFNDSTFAAFGVVDKWSWNIQFPSPTSVGSTVNTHNLSYNFPWPAGNTNLSETAKIILISGSSVGCADTTERLVTIDRAPTLNAGPDLEICKGDSVKINATSDGNNFTWTPVAGLSNSTILTPVIFTTNTSTYMVSSNFNGCITRDTVNVKVSPPPFSKAGADMVKCYEDTVQLLGSGGTVYSWSPAAGLSDPNIRNPLSFATTTTSYVFSTHDTGFCKLIVRDTMVLRVVPQVQVNAGIDTFVKRGNPIQLKGRGAQLYRWEPAGLLNNPNSPVPTAAHLTQPTYFYLRGYTTEGCEDFDTVLVKVLEVEPDIFVPSAFTPNKDRKNDLLKPIGLGAEYVEIFIVYNRWGQEVYQTKKYGEGWDGTINGQPQPNGTYVWYLLARDYKGNKLEKRGITVLIR